MHDQPLPPTSPPDAAQLRAEQNAFYRLLAAILLATMGVTFFVIAFVYVGDLRTMAALPGAVWAFICGVPSQDGSTLPIVILIATLMIASAVILWGYDALRRR